VIGDKSEGGDCDEVIIIIIIIKRKLKAQINRKKASQMRRDDAATKNCRLQCRSNVNETEMSSTVSENRTATLTCPSWVVAVSSRWQGRRSKNHVGQQ